MIAHSNYFEEGILQDTVIVDLILSVFVDRFFVHVLVIHLQFYRRCLDQGVDKHLRFLNLLSTYTTKENQPQDQDNHKLLTMKTKPKKYKYLFEKNWHNGLQIINKKQ